MVRERLLLSLASLAVLGGGLAACGDDKSASTATPAATGSAATPGTATEQTSEASFATLSAKAVPAVAAGAELIDVREQDEWDAGHAKGAQLLPLTQLEAGKLPDLDKSAEIYVYCHSGNRAGVATEILTKAGFTNVTNIGGLTDWETAGGPVVS